MIILAAALTAAINLEINPSELFRRRAPVQEPKVECGLTAIGYRFHGKPGQKFRYAGDEYTIPNERYVELIGSRRRKTYRINNRDLPLDVWPVGTFGFRDVPMPATETADGETALPKVRPSAAARALAP
ncbi:MAG TPA: hypothetical protein VEK57_16215 [Thermoanaerobaculia bacterium]|nr:hypothetical protein [Thermoanaerobaculia bacterium]